MYCTCVGCFDCDGIILLVMDCLINAIWLVKFVSCFEVL